MKSTILRPIDRWEPRTSGGDFWKGRFCLFGPTLGACSRLFCVSLKSLLGKIRWQGITFPSKLNVWQCGYHHTNVIHTGVVFTVHHQRNTTAIQQKQKHHTFVMNRCLLWSRRWNCVSFKRNVNGLLMQFHIQQQVIRASHLEMNALSESSLLWMKEITSTTTKKI